MKDEKAASSGVSEGHVEDPNQQAMQAHIPSEITYDSDGLAGILRSPYVFGATALASFGGFSFGYGK